MRSINKKKRLVATSVKDSLIFTQLKIQKQKMNLVVSNFINFIRISLKTNVILIYF